MAKPDSPQWAAMRAFTKAVAQLDLKGLEWARASIEEELEKRTGAPSRSALPVTRPPASTP